MAKEFTRTLRITYKDTEEGHAARDHNITRINNFLKMQDEYASLSFILDLGIKTALEDIAKTGDKEAKLEVAIQHKLLEFRRLEGRWSNLNKLYDKMTSEQFQEFCSHENVPISEFLEWRERKANDSWTDKVRNWLDDLLRDGNPIQSNAVKHMAIESGLIDPNMEKQQWDYIKVLAHRNGYTGKTYGCWQRTIDKQEPSF
jgi:hypothetical protein